MFNIPQRLPGGWWTLAILFVLLLLSVRPRGALAAANDEDVRLPVRVCLLSFGSAPKLDSTYDEAEVRGLFDEVNKVWRQAGIRWDVDSIVRTRVDATQFPALAGNEDRRAFRRKLRLIAPKIDGERLWQVCIFRQFPIPASGLYVGEARTVFYGELNKRGERYPVVLAHELGHTLGLDHVDDASNLMQGGQSKDPTMTGELDAEQIALAREQAKRGPAAAYGSKSGSERKQAVVRRLQGFDRNADGQISATEVPKPAMKAFHSIDYNRDGFLNRSELDRFLGDGL